MLSTANSSIRLRPAAPPRPQATCKGPLGLMGAPMRFARNTEVYGEEDPAEYLYQVVSGAVRTYRMLEDGRRQISAFYLPGDIFGVEAGDVHASSAEAVCDAHILVAKRSAVMARAEHERDLSKQLWTLTVRELQRIQAHSMLLIRSAEERVAGFLLEMAGRDSTGSAIDLPMCRQDIADYLGLTIETVSRTFTLLVQSGTIGLEKSRRILFRNRAALDRLSA
jgi:CRP/FNR family nitrogen fixation transcriptional regulator